jgi:hypothetical protein
MSGHVTQLMDAVVVAHTHTTTDDLTTPPHFSEQDHAAVPSARRVATSPRRDPSVQVQGHVPRPGSFDYLRNRASHT